MQNNNFNSLDNLELQVQKSSVVQQRAGLVAVYMYKQFIEFHQATVNTNDMFGKILENLTIVLEYLKQSLNIRNVPVQNVTCTIDSTKTLDIVNVLWHKISFTCRFNISPKALPQKNGSPMFCGRIFAINGDFTELIKEEDSYEQQMDILLANEIASLYVPAEKNQGTTMTIRHKDNQEIYISQLDAPREFLLKVIEIVCAGGEFHKQNTKKTGFGF
ncbi:MAG: hypothetical protein IJW73_00210 [Candidatus Gastranaerophilales bacterium]|nr:hypothetical protein [Candidatus Gastranaerophilales bacterium]